jgi:hypothetical protein
LRRRSRREGEAEGEGRGGGSGNWIEMDGQLLLISRDVSDASTSILTLSQH